MKAWLCLGSNLNNPSAQLERAVAYLQEKCYLQVLRLSQSVKTPPYGYSDQPEFINQLVEIDTRLSLEELLKFAKSAEIELGRKPTFKWGPRLIDIDILFYEDIVTQSPDLTVPHPGILNRGYLLKLLYDTIPTFVHPELKLTIAELYIKFVNQGV